MFQMRKVPFARILQALLLLFAVQLAACGSPEQRAQSYYERGMEFLAKKDSARASVEFRNALKLNKNLAPAWLGLAQIEEQNQNWESLVKILRTVVELDPKNVETRLRLTRLLLLGNALDEALTMVNAAGGLDSRHAGVLTTRAAILLKLNDGTGAIREARAALEIDPSNADALSVLAAEKLTRGDAQGALTILEREPAAHANNFGVLLFKMGIYERLGNLEQVESLLRKFVELYPKEPAFRRQLVKLYVSQKRLDEAEKELRVLAAANTSDVEAGLEVVRFLNTTKGPAAAQQELEARIRAGGQVFRYQIALSELHFAQGNFADSFKLLENLAGSASAEQALAAKVKQAEMQLGLKKFDAAEALVSDVLGKDSRNLGGLRLRATIRMERGHFDPAIADLRQALNDQPRSTELMLLLAVAYERSGSIELAEKQFADATRTSNFDAAVGLNYVSFLRRRGEIGRAEEVLTELVGRSPNNVRVLTALAEVRLGRQNWVGAQEVAEAIRRIGDKNHGLADQILGVALSGRNKLDESIQALQSAYAADSGTVQPMFALVSTLVRAKQMDRAVAFLRTVLQKNPQNAEAHVLLGSTQLMSNAPDQAAKSFRTAIDRQPKNMAGYRALADFYLKQKNTDEALKVIRAGLEVQPDSFGMRMTLAGALELKGDYEGAIVEYELLLTQQSGSLIVANNLASLLSDRRTDKSSLERAYSLAVGLRKAQVPQFKDTLGWVQHQRGDHKAAVSLLEEAAAELPNLAMVRYHLGMSYLSDGQLAKASEQLKKALDLAADDVELGEKVKAALKKAGA